MTRIGSQSHSIKKGIYIYIYIYIYTYIHILPETLLIYKNCHNKVNWNTEKRQYNIWMILSYDAGRWMKTECTEIQTTLLLFTAWKNLPLHMQMNSTKLQTYQLLPIVIP